MRRRRSQRRLTLEGIETHGGCTPPTSRRGASQRRFTLEGIETIYAPSRDGVKQQSQSRFTLEGIETSLSRRHGSPGGASSAAKALQPWKGLKRPAAHDGDESAVMARLKACSPWKGSKHGAATSAAHGVQQRPQRRFTLEGIETPQACLPLGDCLSRKAVSAWKGLKHRCMDQCEGIGPQSRFTLEGIETIHQHLLLLALPASKPLIPGRD